MLRTKERQDTGSGARRRGPNPEYTRARLLHAVAYLCSEIESDSIVIEDVLRAAGLSRGTLYTHFESLDHAMAAVSDRLVENLGTFLSEFYRDVEDPVRRLAILSQGGLILASTSPLWSRTLAAWGRIYPAINGYFDPGLALIRKEIARGQALGIFQFDDIRAIMDVQAAMAIQAARILQTITTRKRCYIEQSTIANLRAFGAPNARATEAVRWASSDLRARASKSPRWRELSRCESLTDTAGLYPVDGNKDRIRRADQRKATT